MSSVKDWIFSQLMSTLGSSRPLSSSVNLFSEEPLDGNPTNQGVTQITNLLAPSIPSDAPRPSENTQESMSHLPSQQLQDEDSYPLHQRTNKNRLDPLAKIESLQIKFLRLLQRLGQSQDNLLVVNVLYRIHLATLIRANETDLKRVNLRSNKAKVIAAEQEATGLPELEFSIRILVLGKTGVGKSAFINSIFDQTKAATDAFRPATDHIKEVVGIVNGIKIGIIDTPGLLPPSTNNVGRNRKILFSVKRHIRKNPPDIVLYFDRLDFINMGYNDFPLLKLITDVFGSAIWFNTILVMTHSASKLPEGSNGYPVNFESFVQHCTDLVQSCIHQAVSDSKLENPVLLVENHHQCRTNFLGEKILPNGQVWKSQFMLLSICTKVLGDTNALLNFRGSIELGTTTGTRLPSIPHLLSSLLRHRSVPNISGLENENDDILILDSDSEDEYDQLPPIRILTKSQFEKLAKSQKKEYLNELDYRGTLYLKKQLKEESRKRRETKLLNAGNFDHNDNSENQDGAPEAFLLPDMSVPLSFDSDCPVHRYRYLVTSDQWLARPVLDSQGWDHDVGFDGINLETSMEIKNNIFASVAGQMSKDKQDFSIQSECSAAYNINHVGSTCCLGLDIQSAGKDLMYTVSSNAKLKNLKHNMTECGVSLTNFGEKYYFGTKIEDTVSIGNRVKLVMNGGRIMGLGQVAYGGTFETILNGRDYPVRNDMVGLTMSILSFNKEMVLTGGFQTEFRPSRGMKMSVNANLNNRKMGQICIKTSSSEHLEIALIALFTIFKAVLKMRKTADD